MTGCLVIGTRMTSTNTIITITTMNQPPMWTMATILILTLTVIFRLSYTLVIIIPPRTRWTHTTKMITITISKTLWIPIQTRPIYANVRLRTLMLKHQNQGHNVYLGSTSQKSCQSRNSVLSQQQRQQLENGLRQSISNVELTLEQAFQHLLDRRWRNPRNGVDWVMSWQKTRLTRHVGQRASDNRSTHEERIASQE